MADAFKDEKLASTGRERALAFERLGRTRTRRRPIRLLRPVLREGAPTHEVARRERVSRLALAVADMVSAALAVAIVIMSAGASPLTECLVAMPVILAANKVAGLYDRDDLILSKTTLDEAPQIFQICGLFTLVGAILYEPLTPHVLTSWQLLALWLGSVGLLLVARMVARETARRITGVQRCLVVGDPEAIDTVSRKLQTSRADAEVVAELPVTATHRPVSLTTSVRDTVTSEGIHRVIVAPSSGDAADMLEVIRVAKLQGVRVTVLPRLFEVVGSSVEFDHVDGLTMLGVRRFGLSRSSGFIKRSLDLAGATILLAAAAPVLAVVAVAIRLDSRGPILFRQTRVGRDGRTFEMLKFRSMVDQAETQKAALRHLNQSDGLFKIVGDPRITRVGQLLRRTSLDELPQLFNVWKGEMSLVGPRPLVLDEDAMVQGLDRARLQLTPGMTGPWQLLGATRVPMREMVVIDYLYAANWSLWTDVKILLRTIPHILAGRGH